MCNMTVSVHPKHHHAPYNTTAMHVHNHTHTHTQRFFIPSRGVVIPTPADEAMVRSCCIPCCISWCTTCCSCCAAGACNRAPGATVWVASRLVVPPPAALRPEVWGLLLSVRPTLARALMGGSCGGWGCFRVGCRGVGTGECMWIHAYVTSNAVWAAWLYMHMQMGVTCGWTRE